MKHRNSHNNWTKKRGLDIAFFVIRLINLISSRGNYRGDLNEQPFDTI